MRPTVKINRQCYNEINHTATGKRAFKYRSKADVTQQQVADGLDCVQSFVAALEAGKKCWSEELLERYCVAVDAAKAELSAPETADAVTETNLSAVAESKAA